MGWFVWGFLAGSALFAVTGVFVAWLSYRRLVRAERRARESERLAELGTLTSGLAHEIKNPLSTIKLNLQLLSEDLDPRDVHQARMIHRMDILQRETSRLQEILEDFLRFAGKMELDRKPTDLNDLLEELVDFFLPQAQLQKVQLRLKRDAGPMIAEVDSKFIKQAVLNLMINAVQAMPEGGDLILSARIQDAFARIDIIDTGAGIPPETLKNIFMAYYSTKRSGTGLGLAITQRIAKEHGGSLNVDSAIGKGSDFYLLLPLEGPKEPRTK
jgi:signal transduction histidine kinase